MIQVGDAVVLDFGGLKYGYGSDTTRTVCVGEPTDEIRKVHEIVRQAQQAGVDAVRPGVSCQDVDRAARAVIGDAGYGEAFIHRTGHGIGVTTHEPPYMVEGEERPLMPGMCFSVEPGIYLAGRFGVRIEDIVTVHRGWGTPPQQHQPRAAHRRAIRGGVGHPKQVMRVPRPRKTIDVSDVRRLHRGGIEMRPDHVSTSMSTDGRWAT